MELLANSGLSFWVLVMFVVALNRIFDTPELNIIKKSRFAFAIISVIYIAGLVAVSALIIMKIWS